MLGISSEGVGEGRGKAAGTHAVGRDLELSSRTGVPARILYSRNEQLHPPTPPHCAPKHWFLSALPKYTLCVQI